MLTYSGWQPNRQKGLSDFPDDPLIPDFLYILGLLSHPVLLLKQNIPVLKNVARLNSVVDLLTLPPFSVPFEEGKLRLFP
jgi:hypothetical protein